jgi:hypothetical protein
MTSPQETIADRVKLCWPGFKILENQTVEELRHWIKAEIEQLHDAFEVLEDESIVGPDGSCKLTAPVFAPQKE